VQAHDLARSVTIFGQALLKDAVINCRTSANPTIYGKISYETAFTSSNMAAFQWYDTGQSHILKNIVFRNCTTNAKRRVREFELLTHSDQVSTWFRIQTAVVSGPVTAVIVS
jgi:hypothetical protein